MGPPDAGEVRVGGAEMTHRRKTSDCVEEMNRVQGELLAE